MSSNLVTIITSVSLQVNESYADGQIVFLRSESNQLYSELVNTIVGKLSANQSHDHFFIIFTLSESDESCCACNMALAPSTCSRLREIGAAVGVMICLAIMAVTIVVILCWWR